MNAMIDSFASGSSGCMARQLDILKGILQSNASSQYGAAHGFADILHLDDFRRKVPVISYEQVAPAVHRILAGEQDVLSTSPLYRLVASSGSTQTPKFIPMTKAYCEDAYGPFLKRSFSALKESGVQLHIDPNRILNFRADPLRRKAVLGNGFEHLGLSQISFEDDFSDIPSEPGFTAASSQIPTSIECDLVRIYYRLLLATLADIRYVIGINPAILANVVKLLNDQAERFIADISQGSHLGLSIMPPNSSLAVKLSDCLKQRGSILPSDIWPNIAALICWNSGLAAFYLPQVVRCFGEHTRVVAAPLGASEAAIAVPVHDGQKGEPLAYEACFYEFRDLRTGQLLTAWELEVDKVYAIVVTQQSGLYRYDLKDVVKVVGFLGDVPRVQYRGRHKEGEVLQEFEFLDIAEDALKDCPIENMCTTASEGMLQVHIEFLPQETNERKRAIARQLKTSLHGHLVERGVKSGIQVLETQPGAFYSVWSARVKAGSRAAQVKDQFRLDPALAALLRSSPIGSD
jgi:hypothetical protein